MSFYRVGQKMDSGYFMLDEAKDLSTACIDEMCGAELNDGSV